MGEVIQLRAFHSFKNRDFRLYFFARFLGLTSLQMLNVALGQYIYELTHNPLYLGYVGLTIFLPKFLLTLLTGHVADRYDRRQVIFLCRVLQFSAVLILITLTWTDVVRLGALYATLTFLGIAIAFDGPASQAIVPQLVPVEHFHNAVTWNSSVVQISFILGPVLAGILYALGSASIVFYVVAAMRLGSALLVYLMKYRSEPADDGEVSWKNLIAGIRYVFNKRILLGVMSLDLFAVLLGGAVALLPVFANEIFKVGAGGLGVLRAAPAVGATLTAVLMAHRPPLRHAGKVMLACVATFGLFTIFFGLSKNFYLSLFFLAVLGAADMVSVVIRGVVVQLATPDSMRGRVSAVNFVFIGASNELGEFESGLTAAWFGTVPAVVLGGLGTLLVVGLWSWRFQEILRFKRLDQRFEGV